MELNYKITFYSLWHCGSGDTKGADIDALVIKDVNGLPYIPGKTLKGLIREGMKSVVDYQPQLVQENDIELLFGVEGIRSGICFFGNAHLPKIQYDFLSGEQAHDFKKYLFTKISSTAINSTTGVADEHSLRSIEVTVPVELEAVIQNIPDNYFERVNLALKMIKVIGTGRYKGFGRCKFEVKGVEYAKN